MFLGVFVCFPCVWNPRVNKRANMHSTTNANIPQLHWSEGADLHDRALCWVDLDCRFDDLVMKLHLVSIILLEGSLPKPGNPYCGPTTKDQWPTNQLTSEELKYSRNRARRHWGPTNNLLGVWQNLGIFGGRPIGAAVEALLTIVVNWQ
jgi:hypothetical protein